MTFLTLLLSVVARLAGTILTTTLGWAGTLLFGRVSGSRQLALVAITFGSVLWLAMLLGLLLPSVGSILVALVPFVSDALVRGLMLVGVLVIPALVGATIRWFAESDGRSRSSRLVQVLRGYPLTATMAFLLVFLAALGIARKTRSLSRRWTDNHVPVIVKPGGYDTVAADLQAALGASGLTVECRDAPPSMAVPARLLAWVAGPDAAALVPERLVALVAGDLEVLVYPSDVMILGKPESVARARAAMASRLATTAAYLTTAPEAQALEDRLGALERDPVAWLADARTGLSAQATLELAAVDRELARRQLAFEDWELLYRERLRVERDLRAGSSRVAAVKDGRPGVVPLGSRLVAETGNGAAVRFAGRRAAR